MSSEYYGVASTPMDDFLAHYGVKGMKWGVRKAIQSGNSKALDRQFNKAAKRLAKLNERTDVEVQTNKANKLNKLSKITRRIGHVGAAVGGLSLPYENVAQNIYTKQYNKHWGEDQKYLRNLKDNAENSYDMRTTMIGDRPDSHTAPQKYRDWANASYENERIYKNDIENYKSEKAALDNQYEKNWQARDRRVNAAKIARVAGAATAAAGYGTAIGAKIGAYRAKKLTTSAGHAKAVAERDAWKNEMKSAFKGTKYAGQYSVSTKKRRKK